MSKNNPTILELRRLAKQARGLLSPEAVVEAARPVSSPLHEAFTWDDSEAAQNYRLWQARQLIRTTVEYLKINGDEKTVRVFVSLTPDREDVGGYREVLAVLRNPNHRAQMLADALAELRAFELKYANLKELAGIFAAARKIRVR